MIATFRKMWARLCLRVYSVPVTDFRAGYIAGVRDERLRHLALRSAAGTKAAATKAARINRVTHEQRPPLTAIPSHLIVTGAGEGDEA